MQFKLDLIKKLEKHFDLPLYIFNEKEFTDNYLHLENCFKKAYCNYRISYSYKTNYTPYVCNLVKKLGGYAEVVSGMEYDIAKKIGYNPEHIIFNGPNKGQAGLDAVYEQSIVNVDNIFELINIIDLAKINPDKNFKIGLRANIKIGQNFISRFGMDQTDLEKAFKMVSEIDNLKIVGLQCHISRCRDVLAWKHRTEFMLSLADKYFDDVPEYLDLGSGMFGKMAPEFASQFSNVPTYDDYAEVTAVMVDEHYKDVCEDKKPILFTEPGTTLISKYIDLLCKVEAIKNIDDKPFAILNCSEHNLGETCLLKKLPIEVIHNNKETNIFKNLDFTGYTCLEQDVMYTDYNGELAVDDYIVFGNVGGYSNVLKPPFIRPNCAMVVIDCNEEIKIIKKKETTEDIINTYLFEEIQ